MTLFSFIHTRDILIEKMNVNLMKLQIKTVKNHATNHFVKVIEMKIFESMKLYF